MYLELRFHKIMVLYTVGYITLLVVDGVLTGSSSTSVTNNLSSRPLTAEEENELFIGLHFVLSLKSIPTTEDTTKLAPTTVEQELREQYHSWMYKSKETW